MQEVYKNVAQKLKYDVEYVKKLYRHYWEYIKTSIQELPLKDDLSEEEFKSLHTSFNLPNLGKLACTYDNWLRLKNNEKIKKSNHVKHKENKTS
jgi:hypothetical protein